MASLQPSTSSQEDARKVDAAAIEEEAAALFSRDEADADDALWQPLALQDFDSTELLSHYQQELPEITLSEEDWNQFRDEDLNSQDWQHVFDDELHDQQERELHEQQGDTLGLLDQLEQLNLGNEVSPEWMEDLADLPPIFLPNGDVQPWLYCQPCASTDTSTVTNTTNTPTPTRILSQSPSQEQIQAFLEPWDHKQAASPAASTDIDHLLEQLSIQSATQQQQQQTMKQSTQNQPQVSQVVAVDNSPVLQQLIDSFGVAAASSETVQNHNTKKSHANRKLCLGHRERILGVGISPDTKYFATAAADSTIRIWHDQRLIATLRGHSTQHECLRVVWASDAWIQQIAVSGWDSRTPLLPNHDETVKSSVPTAVNKVPPPKIVKTYWIATGGADGVVYLWAASTTTTQEHPTDWRIYATLDHSAWAVQDPDAQDGEPEAPQIYALNFIDDWQGLPSRDVADSNAFLLTSSDDHVHLWEWQPDVHKKVKLDDGWSGEKTVLREVLSMRFGLWQDADYGVTVGQVTGNATLDLQSTREPQSPEASNLTDEEIFGGKNRNPRGIVYVFDAAYSYTLGCLGVALSDGTVRLLNGRGICFSVLQLPHLQAHLTSLCWSATTNVLATAVATGEVVTWQIWPGHTPVCRAILSGGHVPGRPLFGVGFFGLFHRHGPEHDATVHVPEALLSWGVDGRLCVWEMSSQSSVDHPVATLVDDPDYPLYAVAFSKERLVTAGGGSDGGLIGIPVHMYALKKETEGKSVILISDSKQETVESSASIGKASPVSDNKEGDNARTANL